MPWVECNVTRAGPAENGTIYIALRAKNNSFHNWFVAVPAMEREMLATALTAILTPVKSAIKATAAPMLTGRLRRKTHQRTTKLKIIAGSASSENKIALPVSANSAAGRAAAAIDNTCPQL